MSKCRSCKVPKWRGDICTNVECVKSKSPAYRIIPKTGRSIITVAVKHGFHAEVYLGATR